MVPKPVAMVLPPGIPVAGPDAPRALAEWLFSPAGRRHAAVRRYLSFLKLMYETYAAIQEGFLLMDTEQDQVPKGAATSTLEMLCVANHLYSVVTEGVPGVVLECGAYKGFSACCLSHACGYLGRTLIVADSFQGLPEPDPHESGQYSRADFSGSLEEVRDNLETLGRPEVVELHTGYFESSLTGWELPIALLWMDVDLYASARAVLDGVYAHLSPGASIFCHEFLPRYVRSGAIVHEREPPGALARFLREEGREYSAAYVRGWLGVVSFAGSVGQDSHLLLDALIPELTDRDHRMRAWGIAGLSAVTARRRKTRIKEWIRRQLKLRR